MVAGGDGENLISFQGHVTGVIQRLFQDFLFFLKFQIIEDFSKSRSLFAILDLTKCLITFCWFSRAQSEKVGPRLKMYLNFTFFRSFRPHFSAEKVRPALALPSSPAEYGNPIWDVKSLFCKKFYVACFAFYKALLNNYFKFLLMSNSSLYMICMPLTSLLELAYSSLVSWFDHQAA